MKTLSILLNGMAGAALLFMWPMHFLTNKENEWLSVQNGILSEQLQYALKVSRTQNDRIQSLVNSISQTRTVDPSEGIQVLEPIETVETVETVEAQDMSISISLGDIKADNESVK